MRMMRPKSPKASCSAVFLVRSVTPVTATVLLGDASSERGGHAVLRHIRGGAKGGRRLLPEMCEMRTDEVGTSEVQDVSKVAQP